MREGGWGGVGGTLVAAGSLTGEAGGGGGGIVTGLQGLNPDSNLIYTRFTPDLHHHWAMSLGRAKGTEVDPASQTIYEYTYFTSHLTPEGRKGSWANGMGALEAPNTAPHGRAYLDGRRGEGGWGGGQLDGVARFTPDSSLIYTSFTPHLHLIRT